MMRWWYDEGGGAVRSAATLTSPSGSGRVSRNPVEFRFQTTTKGL